MARPSIESRPTLDDLFGPDLDEVIADAHSMIELIHEDEPRFLDETSGRMVEEAAIRLSVAMEEVAARQAAAPLILVQVRGKTTQSIWGANLDCVSLSRANETTTSLDGSERFRVGDAILVPEEGTPRFRVLPHARIRAWLTIERWKLDGEAMCAVETIRRVLDRMASFAMRAVTQCLETIDAALSLLRQSPASDNARDVARVPRDLIAELVGPAVLAAGGQCALFVPRA